MRRQTHTVSMITLGLVGILAIGCESATDPAGAEDVASADVVAPEPGALPLGAAYGEEAELCHRTNGRNGFRPIAVAAAAVDAHLGHGDVRVGDPVPGRPGMIFDGDCEPVQSRTTTAVSGRWTGTVYYLSRFTVSAAGGPVDASLTVTGFEGEMRIALLGYNPAAPVSTCSTEWLAIPTPIGPGMETPTISARWDDIPAGTYCLNVVTTTPVPPYPEPYSWTGTVTYP